MDCKHPEALYPQEIGEVRLQNACGGGQERQELLTQDYTEQLCLLESPSRDVCAVCHVP